MTIRRDEELIGLRRAGALASQLLRVLRAATTAGCTTTSLDALAEEELAAVGARSAPRLVYGFPGATCISVNDEVVHGVPSDRVLGVGDVVKLDVTVELEGFMADTACTVVIGGRGGPGVRLAAAARSAFRSALRVVRAGTRPREIGRAVEAEVRRQGFRVVRELSGHGRTIHEEPAIPNYDEPSASRPLEEGAVITIEPLITSGSGEVVLAGDGWTVRTRDVAPGTHYEHTIVVRRGPPLVLTAA